MPRPTTVVSEATAIAVVVIGITSFVFSQGIPVVRMPSVPVVIRTDARGHGVAMSSYLASVNARATAPSATSPASTPTPGVIVHASSSNVGTYGRTPSPCVPIILLLPRSSSFV